MLLPVLISVFAACGGKASDTQSADATPPVVAQVRVTPPPLVRLERYADTLHGEVVSDPLRWLEDTTSAEVRAFITAQSAYSDSILARLTGLDSLQAIVEHALEVAPTLDAVVQTPARLFLTRFLGANPSLFAVDSGTKNERLVVSDAVLKSKFNGADLRAIVPSWDGAHVALGTTQRGDAGAAIHLIDATTGAMMPDRVLDLLTSTSGTRYEVTWLPDGSGFFYPRMWPGSATGPAADRLARGRQFLHMLGTPQSRDVPVFGFEVSSGIAMDIVDLPTRVYTAPGSSWLVGSVFRSRANGTDFFFAPLVMPVRGAPAWKPLASVRGELSAVQLRGDTVYAISHETADRGQIVRRVLRPDGDGAWDIVVPEQAGVIMTFTVQRDALYYTERTGDAISLRRVASGSTDRRTVPLPAGITIRLSRGQPMMAGAMVSIDSWSMAPHWLQVQANGVDTASLLVDDGSIAASFAGATSERLEARSKYGTMVPVSLVYGPNALRNGVLDGTAPLLIEAYGGFGTSTDPFYFPQVQAWLAMGGVYAYAHVRGGGELGKAWHTAATRENKQRSIDDMIGVVEHLIAKRYTSAGRVVITGTSFGANIPGLAMVQRPELFGAVMYEVGQPDEIRGSMLDPTAARNIAEIGDLDTPEGIRALMQSSPYHNVPASVALPAVIVHSASDDYNFGTQMLPGKFVAKLQQANSGTRPILWVRTAGGHRSLLGMGPEWAAKAFAFMLWQTGDSRYQARQD